MDEAEVIQPAANVRVNHIPKPLAVIFSIIMAIYTLYLGLMGLATLAGVFGISIAAGIIMLLLAIGFIPFIPAAIAISSFSWFENVSEDHTPFEYWAKVILLAVAALVVPYLASFVSSFVTMFLAAFIAHFVH